MPIRERAAREIEALIHSTLSPTANVYITRFRELYAQCESKRKKEIIVSILARGYQSVTATTRDLENGEETESKIRIDPRYRFERECSYREKKIGRFPFSKSVEFLLSFYNISK